MEGDLIIRTNIIIIMIITKIIISVIISITVITNLFYNSQMVHQYIIRQYFIIM